MLDDLEKLFMLMTKNSMCAGQRQDKYLRYLRQESHRLRFHLQSSMSCQLNEHVLWMITCCRFESQFKIFRLLCWVKTADLASLLSGTLLNAVKLWMTSLRICLPMDLLCRRGTREARECGAGREKKRGAHVNGEENLWQSCWLNWFILTYVMPSRVTVRFSSDAQTRGCRLCDTKR